MILFSEKHPYVLRKHKFQLGWVIVRSDIRKRLLHTSDKDYAREVYEYLVADYQSSSSKKREASISDFDNIPQDFVPKLFVIELKDYTEYILIDSEENFKDSLFNLIKTNLEGKYTPFQKWVIPESLTECILSDSQIENLPTKTLREKITCDVKKSKIELEAYERHNSIIDEVEKFIKDGDSTDVFQLFLKLDSIWWIRYEIREFYNK